ncbi:MAG: hypothetical protein ACTSPY_15155 [Candidatus Helarchaeota archaeon]
MAINEELNKFEALYKKLMTEDNTPDDEAQAKMELLEIISDIEAKIGNVDNALKKEIDTVKELVLSWDPYGPWFKEDRNLVKNVYNLITSLKKLKYLGQNASKGNADVSNIQNLKNEIQGIKNEFSQELKRIKDDIKNIKKSITIIVKTIQSGKQAITLDQNIKGIHPEESTNSVPTPIPISSPINLKRVPSSPEKSPETITPKTPSKFKSIPVPEQSSPPPIVPSQFKSVPVSPTIKPEPIPTSPVQTSISLDDISERPLEVEIDSSQLEPHLEEDNINLQAILSDKKPQKIESRTDKDTLFNIFSGIDSKDELEQVNDELTPIPAPTDSPFKVISPPNDQIVKPTPITIYPDDDSDEQEVIQLTIDDDTSNVNISQTEVDPETLYQELINLEGKRYSLERSIRDLKRDREIGKISDNEYKSKLNKLVKDLKSISKRIEDIREHLD